MKREGTGDGGKEKEKKGKEKEGVRRREDHSRIPRDEEDRNGR